MVSRLPLRTTRQARMPVTENIEQPPYVYVELPSSYEEPKDFENVKNKNNKIESPGRVEKRPDSIISTQEGTRSDKREVTLIRNSNNNRDQDTTIDPQREAWTNCVMDC
ncbi:vacA [Acrasis kona]|uniref:VacA n=1 Tax=Acrasis kona TaxID=1008807 RepID=A0AAW2YH72_9EUKA